MRRLKREAKRGLAVAATLCLGEGPLAAPYQRLYTLNNLVGCPTIGVHFTLAYSMGATSVLSMIPLPVIMDLFACFLFFYYMVIGLSRMHEIRTSNAAIVVFFPYIVC